MDKNVNLTHFSCIHIKCSKFAKTYDILKLRLKLMPTSFGKKEEVEEKP